LFLAIKKLKIAVNGSVIVNVVLFGLQLYAAISSGSLSLFATMADSFMDLLSNSILLFAGKAANVKNILQYPTVREFNVIMTFILSN
jgi:divalent metal cation (Fe/Co/Zn/Cd) transporter